MTFETAYKVVVSVIFAPLFALLGYMAGRVRALELGLPEAGFPVSQQAAAYSLSLAAFMCVLLIVWSAPIKRKV